MFYVDAQLSKFVNSLPGGNIWIGLIMLALFLYLPVLVHISKGSYSQAFNSFGRLTSAFLAIVAFFTIPLGVMILSEEWKSITNTAGRQHES